MMDEDGISIWMNDVPLHQLKYGAVIPHLDVGDQTEFTVSTFSGKKPGAWVTLVGVTTMQIWFKDRGHKKGDIGRFIKDNHSMGLKMTQSEGISHGVKGMIGQFIAPAAYEAVQSRSDDGPNFVVFHNRHVPANKSVSILTISAWTLNSNISDSTWNTSFEF